MIRQAVKDFLNLQPKQLKQRKKQQQPKIQKELKIQTEPQKVDLKDYKVEAEFEKQPDWFDLVPQNIREKPKKVRQSWMTNRQKHLLFTNPGKEKCEQLVRYFKNNTERPLWSIPFPEFEYKNGQILFENKKLAIDKQKIVRDMYFHPQKPQTIEHIAFELQKKYCNISKSNVRDCLRRIETYQLNFGRRKPKDLKGIFSVTQRGIVVYDLAFPDRRWDNKNPILVVMDIYTRYTWVRSLENKTKKLVQSVIETFLRFLVSNGIKISVLLSDLGSEFSGMENLARKFDAKVLQAPTGKPILAIESQVSSVKRRMELFLTAGLVTDSTFLTKEIERQLNNRPIRNKMNYTPNQLLNMSDKEIESIYIGRREFLLPSDSQIPLEVGNYVRYLTWTRKEQVSKKTEGFKQKWSKTIHRVEKLRRIKKGVDAFRYKVSGIRFLLLRHELLKVVKPERLDKIVPDNFVFVEDVTYVKQDYEIT